MKNINLKDNLFVIISLILTGTQGYFFLAFVNGFPNLKISMLHPVHLFFAFEITCAFIFGYLIYLIFIKKRDINIKEILYCLFFAPILFWSYIGQLGNSDALAIIFGDFIGLLYYICLIPIYIYYLIRLLNNNIEINKEYKKELK